jgi:hypothetical protein
MDEFFIFLMQVWLRSKEDVQLAMVATLVAKKSFLSSALLNAKRFEEIRIRIFPFYRH